MARCCCALPHFTPGTGPVPERRRAGINCCFAWLKQNGVDTAALRMTDGSGLSRYNLVTPRATVQLLAAVQRLPGGDAMWNALPLAGVDGTLGRRMKGTAAQNNVRAKTGTFSIVSTLSGYVTTRDGHRLAVSLLTNFARDGREARKLQDEIYALLAATQWSR
jgi:D-alanyl-D-alanine carboxypeptidase/D-alanyl-D-alanine-endopeptidase (penicillin-binding protein 4)